MGGPRALAFLRSGLVAASLALCSCVEPPPEHEVPLFAFAILPDTQGYAGAYPEIFESQTRWIADHAEALNIDFVLHVGDVTNGNSNEEWDVARVSFSHLDGVVPYALVPGNHDYYPDRVRSSRLSEFFPLDEQAAGATFGGAFAGDSSDNTYHLFSAGGMDWLVVALEWAPRALVLEWAGQVLGAHPDHYAIILTHAYTYIDGRRYDWVTRGEAQAWNPHSYPVNIWPEVSDGQELWDKVILHHTNVRFVLSGHAHGGTGHQTSLGADGFPVHELHSNYQDGPMGGNGYLRLMNFHDDRIHVQTYSPYLDDYLRAAGHDYMLFRNDL